MDNIVGAAVVVVPGLPKKLAYTFDSSQRELSIGSQVIVEVGRRQAVGYVVEKLPLQDALEQFKTAEAKPNSFSQNQLTLFNSPLERAPDFDDRLKFKSVLSFANAFLPDQLELFEWMAKYYGANLSEVIENAIPQRKVLKRERKRTILEPAENAYASPKPKALTAAQEHALREILSATGNNQFQSLLLYGVTGSGKTEVYLRAIEEVIKQGGSALLIVPEISLTPQLLDHFQARLELPLAVLHSQIGQTERWQSWESLLRGERKLAIGARSAVFAPLQNLSLIIVDEEHESSYKQSDGLRYNARDVAVMRAKFLGCPVILGSATPSFESLLNANRGRYKLLELPERATLRPVPTIEIVDLKSVKKRDMPSENLSPTLHQAIAETLAEKGQVVILYNRRGFSSYLQCDTCGEVVSCPNCSVTLTYHKAKHRVVCHYCGLSTAEPAYCDFCRNPRMSQVEIDNTGKPLERIGVTEKVGKLRHLGGGTEKVVDELKELFPQAAIVRMDRDTVGQKGAYRQILGEMRSGKADILVGTQMIAKGHDLPGVTLVGIIDADVGLHLPDFRSSEKVFQLITQAAGRAGRGSVAGRVLVQTREPHHPTIVATATGRFKAFARYELEFRKKLNYPPWGKLMRLVISSPDRQDAFRATEAAYKELEKLLQSKIDKQLRTKGEAPKASLLGPAQAPHEKLRGRYRWHILVKSSSSAILSDVAQELSSWKRSVKGDWKDFRLSVDIDPVDML